MKEQSSTTRLPVIIAGLALVLAAAAFGAVYYVYDGAAVVDALMARFVASSALDTSPEPASASDALELPDGMGQDFALGVWEEQIDSQSLLRRLVKGEVVALRVDEVKDMDDEVAVGATVTFKDGSRAPGVIGMRRFKESWYIAYISSRREGDVPGGSEKDVADISEVDVSLLNTVMGEQRKSREFTQGLADGTITSVVFGKPQPGSNTIAVPLEMNSKAEKRYADLIAIRTQVKGEDMWFVARFNKTGSNANN